MPRVTIADIASAVGVSTGAVSLALRDSSKISKARKIEITAMAEKLGYRKNPLVSALMANRSKKGAEGADEVIAWVVGQKESKLQSTAQSLTKEVLRGIHDEAYTLGFRVDGFSVDECLKNNVDLGKLLVSRGIRGMVIGPEVDEKRQFPFSLDPFSCVAVSNFYPSLRINRIMTDMFDSTRLALTKLREAGVCRIGLVCPRHVDIFSNELIRAAFELHNSKINPKDRVPFLSYEKLKYENIIAWYKKHRPQGILTIDPRIPESIRQTGVRIPGDLRVILLASEPVCLNGLHYCVCSTNPYVGGRLIMSNLADDLSMNRTGTPLLRKLILVEPKWIPGETLL